VRVEDVELALLGDDEGAALLGGPLRVRRPGEPERAEEVCGSGAGPDQGAAAQQVAPAEPSLDEGRFAGLERGAVLLHDTLLRPVTRVSEPGLQVNWAPHRCEHTALKREHSL